VKNQPISKENFERTSERTGGISFKATSDVWLLGWEI